MTTVDKIMQEVQRLPEPLAREVLDFIGYIAPKHGLTERLSEGLKEAQAPAMSHIWDNRTTRSGMTCKPGDLALIPFPYSDPTAYKKRPVLVLTGPDRHDDFIAPTGPPTASASL
jgi:hypothetical protein